MKACKIGLIGGSGLGEVLASHPGGRRHQVDTPFGAPSDAIVESEWNGLPVFVLPRHGPGHLLSPSQVPYRANIFALKTLGVTHIIASGAVGSLREELKPRDLVIVDQVIDKTYRRVPTFFEKSAVHVEFAEPFCPALRGLLLEEGTTLASADAEAGFTVHSRGCYVCMEGPAFSTRAESLMHRLWGGDVIGMTAMPEAKLAREAEIAYALVALPTDYDCWKRPPAGPADAAPTEGDAHALLKEIIANLRAASDNAMRLIRRVVERIAADPTSVGVSPAHSALQLAIWSDKSRLPGDEVQRLAPLWMQYMNP